MTSMQIYVRQSRHTLRKLLLDPRLRRIIRGAGCFLGGFCLSAASLAHHPMPLAMGMVCASVGMPGLLWALGGTAGYVFFWGGAGQQGLLWLAAALPCALFLGGSRISREAPLLMSAIGALIVSAGGVIFQQWLGDETPVLIYLLRVALGAFSTWVFQRAVSREDARILWLGRGLMALALAQIAPIPWLNLGCVAAGAMATAGAFPGTALAGLALDLAGISRVSMTAAVCLGWFWRLLPGKPRWLSCVAPAVSFLAVAYLCGIRDLRPLPALALGGFVGMLWAGEQIHIRRGETGVVQVRLEMAATALSQTRQLLLETDLPPVDEGALISRCAERACGGCPCRKGCKDREDIAAMPAQLLHRPLPQSRDLPVVCRKSNRVLLELQRCQEQLRAIRADRERQREYQGAVAQQYGFLAAFLQDLSDTLPRRGKMPQARFSPRVEVFANRPAEENGDRVFWFSGVGCRFYVLLCDGMGRGIGAVDAGNAAGKLLRQMLRAGFPGEYALRSLNSLCALRQRAGIVTVDLLEVELDTGKATLYKWGAPCSYLVGKNGAEKIGTTVPPPGLSAVEGRETVERLSLRRGETLLMVSDGVGGEDALRRLTAAPNLQPGELAAFVLEQGTEDCTDDATVAAVRLVPSDLDAS